ncbi:hypothetical protein G9P44_004763 [Scheffersomyces stipitis]|nr:hypothetical protein G9P44_004763 [Scheffersomyces stipitis]
MSLQGKFFKLSNGNTIPAVGYGTGTKWFKSALGDIDTTLVDTLVQAIKLGFTHIDGAQIYKTSREIGLAIKKSGIKREDLFLTDKFFSGPSTLPKSTSPNPYDALKQSLAEFQLEYVDLYLLHTPYISKESHGYDVVEAWNYLEKLQDEGLVKNIGVSNFAVDDLQKILNSNPKHKPVVNQIEYSAYLQNQTPGVVEFAKKNGILIEAYGPSAPITKGKGGPLDPVLEKLAKKYNKTEAQIILRWVLDTGVLPVTTSSKEDRIKAFLELTEFKLDAEDVKEISEVGKEKIFRQFFTEYSRFD